MGGAFEKKLVDAVRGIIHYGVPNLVMSPILSFLRILTLRAPRKDHGIPRYASLYRPGNLEGGGYLSRHVPADRQLLR